MSRSLLPVALAGGLLLSSTSASAQAVAHADGDPSHDIAMARPTAPVITPNSNVAAAGTLTDGVLHLSLEARAGTWHPEGPKGRGLLVAAFGEEGGALLNPGPMIRVPVGTEVRVSVSNRLDDTLTVFGLGTTRGLGGGDMVIPPGERREARFTAAAIGTYYYSGRTTADPVFFRFGPDSQLNGAIVVDAADLAAGDTSRARRHLDRPMLISWWGIIDPQSPTGLRANTMAINGLSWPHTERFHATEGDSLHWRWINVTGLGHPMHLHGFYFRVDARGDGTIDTVYAPDARRLAVTELVDPGQTASVTWSPSKPGNWIFHCHVASHVSHIVDLDTDGGTRAPDPHAAHGGESPHQMAGLVIGIHVRPNGDPAAAGEEIARPLRLVIRSKPSFWGDAPGLGYALGGTPDEADDAPLRVPGPQLVLERGRPVEVTIVNRSHEPAAVHWHGIELDSYADGVPGWSGEEGNLVPSIPAGDSLTVRFTPPRAGTFIYHSHFNELGQIASGLYGPLLVLEEGATHDPETDRVLVFSDGGPLGDVVFGPFPPVLLNGKQRHEPIDLEAGTRYRLRLVNIKTELPMTLALLDGEEPLEWTLVAKDGADLPETRRRPRPARLASGPGEVFDFEFTPREPGDLTLRFGNVGQTDSGHEVRIRVR